jgi:hypothetical protein
LPHASATVCFGIVVIVVVSGSRCFLSVDGFGQLHSLLDEVITEGTDFFILFF